MEGNAAAIKGITKSTYHQGNQIKIIYFSLKQYIFVWQSDKYSDF